MLAGFAEFERNIISERTSAALRHKRAHGQVFNHTPYGFDAADGILTPNPKEQSILERLKAMRKAGNSYSRIAKELNAEGIPSKMGGAWHPFSVQKVLTA